jgi:hypothetical protein
MIIPKSSPIPGLVITLSRIQPYQQAADRKGMSTYLIGAGCLLLIIGYSVMFIGILAAGH